MSTPANSAASTHKSSLNLAISKLGIKDTSGFKTLPFFADLVAAETADNTTKQTGISGGKVGNVPSSERQDQDAAPALAPVKSASGSAQPTRSTPPSRQSGITANPASATKASKGGSPTSSSAKNADAPSKPAAHDRDQSTNTAPPSAQTDTATADATTNNQPDNGNNVTSADTQPASNADSPTESDISNLELVLAAFIAQPQTAPALPTVTNTGGNSITDTNDDSQPDSQESNALLIDQGAAPATSAPQLLFTYANSAPHPTADTGEAASNNSPAVVSDHSLADHATNDATLPPSGQQAIATQLPQEVRASPTDALPHQAVSAKRMSDIGPDQDQGTSTDTVLSPWQLTLTGRDTANVQLAKNGHKQGQNLDDRQQSTPSTLSAKKTDDISNFSTLVPANTNSDAAQKSASLVPPSSPQLSADKLVVSLTTESSKQLGTYGTNGIVGNQRGNGTNVPAAVEQVMLHISRAAKSGDDQISLQLRPAELGQVTVKLDVQKNGSVTGTVVADNPETLAALVKDQRSLEKSLNDAGLRAEPGSLQFSLGQQADHSNKNAQQQGGNTASANGRNVPESQIGEDIPAATHAEIYQITPSRVNIRV